VVVVVVVVVVVGGAQEGRWGSRRWGLRGKGGGGSSRTAPGDPQDTSAFVPSRGRD
jgi:hypothetical protein